MNYIFAIAIATCLGHVLGRLISELIFLGVNKVDKQINKIKTSLDKGEKDTKKLLKMDKKQDKKLSKMKKGKC